MEDTFYSKYNEFCVDLEGACPELKNEIEVAKNLPNEEKLSGYITVFKTRRQKKDEHLVLPNVVIPNTLWNSLSKKSQDAIEQYNSILDLCVIYKTGDTEGVSQEWVDSIMREWRSKMEKIDFSNLSSRFFELFGKNGDSLPPLPEKFLKGHMARLAEDLVKEFDPEDFGFTQQDLEECEKNPARSFEILMRIGSRDPTMIQKALQKISKRLQEKIQKGMIRPQDLAAEAEELMKEFQTNPAFVEIMETFRSAFNFEDMDLARATGNEGSARLSLVKQRLKKKLEAKKANKNQQK
jgi:hypothetical protein